MFWSNQSLLVLLVDVSVKSFALALLAATALAVLRVRNTNVRHRVWTAVLLGMLALPLLVPVTPTVPMPSYLSPDFSVRHTALNVAADTTDGAVVAPTNMATSTMPGNASLEHLSGEGAFSDQESLPVEVVTGETILPISTTTLAAKSSATRRAVSIIRVHWPTLVSIAYLTIVSVFLIRILLGFLSSRRIVARSQKLKLERQPIPANVRVSAELRVPLTVGCLRPKILLPTDWGQWSPGKLAAVLAHESAHVRRKDYLVTLLAELNRAIHWFHPLAWLLRKKLAELAERNCDDEVIASTGERTQYARHLLEVASSLRGHRGRLAWSGVAMARKPNVETRIDAILDSKRPLARHIGLAGALLLVATAVPAVLLAAAIRPAEKSAAEESAAATTDAKISDESKSESSNKNKPGDLPSEITGQVLGPDGQPIQDAVVYSTALKTKTDSTYWRPKEVDWHPIAETTSDGNGRFTLSLGNPDRPQVENARLMVVAYAAGYGPALIMEDRLKKTPKLTLRLVEDMPINGRVVDTEGTPIANVAVKLRNVIPSRADEAVAQWIEEADAEDFRGEWQYRDLGHTMFPHEWSDGHLERGARPFPPNCSTDADGRFSFAGLGANRLAILEVSGSNIATQILSVVTREMKPLLAHPWKQSSEGTSDPIHHGAKVDLVAHPSQPIFGTVTDAETGKPLPNMTVLMRRVAGKTHLPRADLAATQTDANGRYELHGTPHGGGHLIGVRPDNGEPYFKTAKKAPTSSGFVAIEHNLTLRKGHWITGKVTDSVTDKPIQAKVSYFPFRDNPHAKDYRSFNPSISRAWPQSGVITDTAAEGSFRILGIPGEGVLAAHAPKLSDEYRSNIPADLFERIGGERMPKVYNPWSAKWFQSMRLVDVNKDAAETTVDLKLELGIQRRLNIVDSKNRPLLGVQVLGRVYPRGFEKPLDEAHVDIIGMTPGTQRIVYLLHNKEKHGKAILLKPIDGQLTVQLTPCAKVKGRFVDDDEKPIPNQKVTVSPKLEIDNWHRQVAQTTTDQDGNFSVLIPCGLDCRVSSYTVDGPEFYATLAPKAGATYDFGNIPNGKRLAEEDTAKLLARVPTPRVSDNSTTELHQAATTFKGQVLAPDGNGRAGATVYVVSTRLNHLMHPVQETLLAKATADSQGRFDFPVKLPPRDDKLDGSPSHAHFEQIIATADGLGAATSDVLGIRDGNDVTLKLPEVQPIQGQILNLEGQPLAGATLRVLSASIPYPGIEKALTRLREDANKKPGDYTAFLAMSDWSASADVDRYLNERRITQELRFPSIGLPRQVKTDAQGRFFVDGIGKDRMVALELSGPNIVTTWLSVVSRNMHPINKAFFSGCRTNVTYGAKIAYSAEPSQPIQGTVTDTITGKPLANFQVETGRHESGYAVVKTDANGKYRLSGVPKRKTHRLEITPPDDLPYFRRGVESNATADGLAPIVIDARLKPTQWIQGRVTDKVTGKPVTARVVYVPYAENKLAAEYPALVRLRGTFIHPLEKEIGATRLGDTTQDGTYRLPAISGEGLVVVMATDPKYCVGAGKDQLPAGWLRKDSGFEVVNAFGSINPQWTHAMRRVNLSAKETATIDLQVDPGESLALKVTNNAGEPLAGVIVRGQHAMSFGMDHPQESDQVTIHGINNANPRSVLFYHNEKNLGAYLLANGNHNDLADIRLQPCATLKGRLVDSDGKPQANQFVALRAVPPLHESHIPIGQTDEMGRFETTKLIPSVPFKLVTFVRREVTLKEQIALKPGATLDLGDVELR